MHQHTNRSTQTQTHMHILRHIQSSSWQAQQTWTELEPIFPSTLLLVCFLLSLSLFLLLFKHYEMPFQHAPCIYTTFGLHSTKDTHMSFHPPSAVCLFLIAVARLDVATVTFFANKVLPRKSGGLVDHHSPSSFFFVKLNNWEQLRAKWK